LRPPRAVGGSVTDFVQDINCKTGRIIGHGTETFAGSVNGIAGAATLTWGIHFEGVIDCGTFTLSSFSAARRRGFVTYALGSGGVPGGGCGLGEGSGLGAGVGTSGGGSSSGLGGGSGPSGRGSGSGCGFSLMSAPVLGDHRGTPLRPCRSSYGTAATPVGSRTRGCHQGGHRAGCGAAARGLGSGRLRAPAIRSRGRGA
jgi:hypothetical protein